MGTSWMWLLLRAVIAGAMLVWFWRAGWVRIIGGRLFTAVTLGFSTLYFSLLVFFDIRPNNWNEVSVFPVALAVAGLLLHRAGVFRYGRCLLVALYLLNVALTLTVAFVFALLGRVDTMPFRPPASSDFAFYFGRVR